MLALLVLVLAVPVGLLVRNRLVAVLLWGFFAAHVVTVQTGLLVMEWVNGSAAAFPQTPSTSLIGAGAGYFVVTTVIEAVGFGLVLGAGTFAARRRARAAAPQPVG
jgi:hypothetical protein